MVKYFDKTKFICLLFYIDELLTSVITTMSPN